MEMGLLYGVGKKTLPGMRMGVYLYLVMLVLCVDHGCCLQRDALYPFGEFRNDQRMSIGDDLSTPEIQLETPIAFFENSFSSIFINLNGHLSFETEIPVFKSDLILPFGFKTIAPFLADIDTRLSGNVYFRETQDPSLLETATREIQRNFPRAITFNAAGLFIVTWDMVGYYKEQYDQTNTFQVVIASDGFDSYVFFHYVDDGINWIQSEGKSMPVHRDPPAQAGFDAGDFSRSYTLPGSGHAEVRQLATGSNINVHGAWLFRVGDLGGGNIELPPSADINEILPDASSTGLSCAHGCSAEASCTEFPSGSCCKCDQGYFGNGVNCLQTGSPQRINGRVSGTVNGVGIEPVVLHTYVVTSDGRAYTAVSRMPPLIGQSLQVVHTIGGIMGWLFALPSSPSSQNGFTITGGEFNRTATLEFVAGGEKLTINERFEGQGVHGYMKVTTTLSGNIPSIADKARVTVDDYKEDYKRTAPGVIKSYTTHTYRLDGVPYRFTLDQTISYKECSSAPPLSDSARLSVNRNFITFDDREQIVRFAQSNRIIAVSGDGGEDTDPCVRNPCGPNSACTADGERFSCTCNNGYRGEQGTSCRDVDECYENVHDCDYNAQCSNTEGSFECRCNPGYRGNGRSCQRDLSCADLTCDVNARCVFDSDIGQPRCECSAGFVGDGETCEVVEFSCNEVNNCGENAECLYDSAEGRYKCECMDGFSGDGFSCTESEEPTRPPRPTPAPPRRTTTEIEELNCRNCDAHANCVYDVNLFRFRCQCREGFTGDGYSCQEIAEVQDCSTQRNCDVNARCVYDDRIRQHRCVCEHGYRGDGYRCAPEEQDCSQVSICDYNAQCVYDADYRRYTCRCNQGFDGDGRTCRQIEISCNQVNNCDVNAECIYDDVTRNYMCRCRQGYEGDGTSCAPVLDCIRDPNLCDRNARCVRQGYSHVCVCNSGYRGDGSRCAPLGDTNSYLLYTQGLSIMQIPFKSTPETQGKQVLLIPGQTAVGIDVDCYSRYFYWTDVAGKAISRAKLDGTDSEVLVRGLGSPEGVAIDWVAGNMYWTDSGSDTIEVSKIDGTYRKALFNTDIHDPRAVVVDPQAGLLFWSDWYREGPKIEVAFMDGSGRRTLVDSDLGLPNGLAINYRERELCWADAGTMHIECIKYDGLGRRTVYGLASYPFDLTLNGDTIYWTDWDMKSLPSIDRFGGSPNEPMTPPPGGNGKMYGIATVMAQCPSASNACFYNNGGCRFLCLPSPNGGRTCACPDDVEEEECNTINLVK